MMHIINGREQPVAYASQTLSQAERNYAQIEREALALIFGVKKFNQYLYGRQFTLVTDHQPLCKLFGHKEEVHLLAATLMQRWALILSVYTYKILDRTTNVQILSLVFHNQLQQCTQLKKGMKCTQCLLTTCR